MTLDNWYCPNCGVWVADTACYGGGALGPLRHEECGVLVRRDDGEKKDVAPEEPNKKTTATVRGAPKRFRFRSSATGPGGPHHPANAEWQFGTYFPRTDLCVTDMGLRSTGEPKGVDWIDDRVEHRNALEAEARNSELMARLKTIEKDTRAKVLTELQATIQAANQPAGKALAEFLENMRKIAGT